MWDQALRLHLPRTAVAYGRLADQFPPTVSRGQIVGGVGTIYPGLLAAQHAPAHGGPGATPPPAIHTAQHRGPNVQMLAAKQERGTGAGDGWSIKSLLTFPIRVFVALAKTFLPSSLLEASPQTAALGRQSRSSEGLSINKGSLIRSAVSLGTHLYKGIRDGDLIPFRASDWTVRKTVNRVANVAKTVICFLLPAALIGFVSKLAIGAFVGSGIVAGAKVLGYEPDPQIERAIGGFFNAGKEILN